MRVALYARVSRHDKDQEPENQLLKLREYVERQRLDIYDEYVDHASGAQPSRPRLDKMLSEARGHRFQAVVAVKLDRIGRSALNCLEILRDLEQLGIGLICTDQPIDTTTPSGKLNFTVLSAFTEFERELISERTKDGLARAKAEGKRLGRPPNPAKTDEIMRLREEEGLSLRQIGERIGMSHQAVKQRLRRHRIQNGIAKET